MGENKDSRVAKPADRLKEAMALAGMKQADLARSSGLSTGAICRYVSGKFEPKSDAITKMAKALNVAEMWLWGFDVQKERSLDAKKNDQLAELIVKMRRDPMLLEAALILSNLPADQFAAARQLLLTLKK